jgi:hypothetical protein
MTACHYMLHTSRKLRQINNAALRSSRQETQNCATQQPAGDAMLRREASGTNGLICGKPNLPRINVRFVA